MKAFVTGGAGFVGRALVRHLLERGYWASDAKARRELGYAPRDLEMGLRETFASSLPAKSTGL